MKTSSATPSMALRLTWTAMSPSHANRAYRDLMDQIRGAELESIRPAGLRVCARCWYSGQSTYGLELWLEPWADPPKEWRQQSLD